MFNKILFLNPVRDFFSTLTRFGVKKAVLLYVIDETIVEYTDFFVGLTAKDMIRSEEESIKPELEEIVGELNRMGVRAKYRIVFGNPVIETLRLAGIENVSAIFLTSNSPRIGDIVDVSSIPVLVLRGKGDVFKNVIYAVEPSKICGDIYNYTRFCKNLTVLHLVKKSEDIDGIDERLDEILENMEVERIIAKGKPCKEILRVANKKKATLIIVCHSDRIFSTARCVASKSNVSVLVIK